MKFCKIREQTFQSYLEDVSFWGTVPDAGCQLQSKPRSRQQYHLQLFVRFNVYYLYHVSRREVNSVEVTVFFFTFIYIFFLGG